MPGERVRNLVQDAGTVLTHEFEHGHGAACGFCRRRFLAGRNVQAVLFELGQRGEQGLALFCGDFHPYDTGKLTAQAAHAAFQPVAAVVDDVCGYELDQSRAIRADHGHDKG